MFFGANMANSCAGIRTLFGILLLSASFGATPDRCSSKCRCSDKNQIVNCSSGDLESVPVHPIATKTLNLDDNFISWLDPRLLNPTNQSNIQELSLRRNNLTFIDPSTFRGMVFLRLLYLDENRITSLPGDLFLDNLQLHTLSVPYNPITTDQARSAFMSIQSSLVSLDISKTMMTSGGHLPDFLANLTKLDKLTVKEISLANLTNDFFSVLSESPVTHLDMASSVIVEVSPDAFAHLPHLVELDLSRAMFNPQMLENILHGLINSSLESLNLDEVFSLDDSSVITHSMFRNLVHSKLRKLSFVGNFIGLRGKVPEKLFHPLRHLAELNLDDCDLISIPHNSFQGLHALRILSLRRNLLSCTRGSDCPFSHKQTKFSHLMQLDLSDNRLSNAEDTIIFENSTLPTLDQLNLRSNRLTMITKLMFELPKLNRLDLSENLIEDIAPESFSKLTSLTRLDLENCRHLTHLKQGVFTGLEKLKVLNIQNSGLVHIHHAAFAHLGHLEELLMRNNRFGEAKGTIDNVTLRKSSLHTLDVGDNGLCSVPKGLLTKSVHLKRVYLDGNRLTDCRQLAPLVHATNLEHLELSYNSFVEPDKSCFEGLSSSVESIELSHNPFYCSCKTREFFKWFREAKFATGDEDNYVCASPNKNVGLSVFGKEPSDWECYYRQNFLVALLVCSSTISVLLLFGFCFCRKKIVSVECNGTSCPEERSTGAVSMIESKARYSPLEEDDTSRGGQDQSNDRILDESFAQSDPEAARFPINIVDTAALPDRNRKQPKFKNGFHRTEMANMLSSDQLDETCAFAATDMSKLTPVNGDTRFLEDDARTDLDGNMEDSV